MEQYIEKLREIVENCLYGAYEVHEKLGKAGEELIQKNQFSETVLRADIEMEKAILYILKEDNVPIRVVSEEHGLVEIGKPNYLGILDGLDGSRVYKKERGYGRYGTMFGIFENIDPRYQDYLVCGVMEHSTRKLSIAVKGQGAWCNDKPIHTSDCNEFNKNSRIYINKDWQITLDTFVKRLVGFKDLGQDSLAVFYTDLASGNADLVLDCTRKRNLEIMVAYGLETEAGSVMVDLEGESLGQKKYFEFGQDKNIPIISAATKELAESLIRYLKKRS